MHTLRKQDRDNHMMVTVSFHSVPMFRGLAFALHHIEDHGAPIDIFSADRRDEIIAEHNKQFGTHLSGQQHLVDLAARGQGNPANPPNRTSHCLYADAAVGELVHVPVGARIPWFCLGLDLADKGKSEDVRHFLSVANRLGYAFRQPYPQASSERHHVVCVKSPISVLERWNIISKNRSAS